MANPFENTVNKLRESFNADITLDIEYRIRQLKELRRFAIEKEKEILAALAADLGKCTMEGYMGEVAGIVAEIDHYISNIYSWASSESVSVPLAQMKGLSTCEIAKDPLGVVLIIGAWNYPFNLAVGPLIPAIAAGNAVVLKPSEVSQNTTSLLAKNLPLYLDNRIFAIVEGGPQETTELLKLKFDHILYTGNGAVGRIVMKAAAEHLTPVTLELGGKCPAIVDKNVALDVAARRIVWGKFFNAGQTCIGVDHVFVHESKAKELIDLIKQNIKNFYGDDPKKSPDFGRIVNERHVKRISSLLESVPKESIIYGGVIDETERYISPTIIAEPDLNSKLMQEEIFGPLLPIITFQSMENLIKTFRTKDKPLALYLFSNDSSLQEYVKKKTSSGQYVVNEVLMQFTVGSLPFGGVGESGMGRYHGRSGFDTFSHRKSVLNKTTWFDINVRYPPYDDTKLSILKKMV